MPRSLISLALCGFLTVPGLGRGQPSDKLAPSGGAKAMHVEREQAKRVRGVLEYSVQYPNVQATEWFLAVAEAPELPGQSGVRTSLQPMAGTRAKDPSRLNRGLISARLPATNAALRSGLSLTLTYEATLYSRRLVEGRGDAPVVALTDRERREALAETDHCDFKDKGFQKWRKENGFTRRKDEAELDFARRVFLALKGRYKWLMSGKCRASDVCTKREADCGGLAVLFTALMRCEGVPARSLWGRWAASAVAVDGQVYYQWHVEAEFFAADVGWVPVDLSSAVLHDRSAEGLRYFGRDDGDLIVFHVDPDIQASSAKLGKQAIVNLQEPYATAAGGGDFNNPLVTQSWKVTPVDQKADGDRATKPKK
ncbi:MAG: transglutaminase-like domain-containing protein [Gemmataceae bacterium]